MALSSTTLKALASALGRDAGAEVGAALDAAATPIVNKAKGTKFWAIADLIVATATSTTTDFGSLVVGDRVLMIPDVAGSADLVAAVTTAGTLPQAAVVGNAYLVLRQFTIATGAGSIKF